MFDLEDDASQREKCYTTVTRLPAFVDFKQPPTKRSPFSTILGHPYVHTVEVILSEAAFVNIEASLNAKLQKHKYARVFMPLASLLEQDFFSTYIKIGDILMISEGLPGTDNVYTLRDGILRLELGKDAFERTGLTGRPIRSGGRKHTKERYLVELNLRLPSMLHGKKGFERIVWAFENVLNKSVAWLFCDRASEKNGWDFLPQSMEILNNSNIIKDAENQPLQKHQPQMVECDMVRTLHRQVLLHPSLHTPTTETVPNEQEHWGALAEWLAMVSLESPRVDANDKIDPYLSRYSVPDVDNSCPSDLISLEWHGFINPQWVTKLFIALLHGCNAQNWFALSCHALRKEAVDGKDGYTILSLPPVEPRPVEYTSANLQRTLEPRASQLSVCFEYLATSRVPHSDPWN